MMNYPLTLPEEQAVLQKEHPKFICIFGQTPSFKALVASLSEVSIDEAIKAAPIMTSAAPVAPPAGAAAEQKPAAAPAENKKKKVKEEKAKEEAALEGLGALFG